jgi:hypothetical protein
MLNFKIQKIKVDFLDHNLISDDKVVKAADLFGCYNFGLGHSPSNVIWKKLKMNFQM